MKAIQLLAANTQPVISEVSNLQSDDLHKVIKVKCAALNHRDLWIAKGMYAKIKYPVTLGSDLCGYIDNDRMIVNPGFNWGTDDRVQSKEFKILGLPDNGSIAEEVLVPKEYIYPAPEHLSDAQAAALPLAGITAYRALITKCKPMSGESILINGVGGGVALQALQFAHACGLKVYVSSSDDHKIEKAIALGATAGYNYTDEQWDKKLNADISGVDIIIDSAGGSGFQKLVNICKPAARICIFGGTQGAIQDLIPQQIFWKQISIHGSTMGTQTEFSNMLAFVNKYKIIPVVDHEFNFIDVAQAFKRMDDSRQFGKIIININP